MSLHVLIAFIITTLLHIGFTLKIMTWALNHELNPQVTCTVISIKFEG